MPTGRARRRSRPRRSRCPAPTARPAACGCAARRRPAGPGRRAAAGPPLGGAWSPAGRGGGDRAVMTVLLPAGRGGPGRQPFGCLIATTVRPAASPRRCSRAGGAGVGDDPPVQHLDLAAHPGGDGLVVGDHHDRGPGRVQLVQQVEDRRAGGGVEVAGRLVGQHDRRRPGQRAGDRHPLPLPARQLGRPGAQLVAQPDPRAAPGRGLRGGRPAPRPAYSRPSATLSRTLLVLGQEVLLEHEPDRRRPQPRQFPVGQARPRPARSPAPSRCWPGPACPPGAAGWSSPTRTGRAPRPARRPPTARLTPASAVTGGDPG